MKVNDIRYQNIVLPIDGKHVAFVKDKYACHGAHSEKNYCRFDFCFLVIILWQFLYDESSPFLYIVDRQMYINTSTYWTEDDLKQK